MPWLAADLARAAKGRAVFIAPDEGAMRALADAAAYFAPELEVLTFPAWDCLPYDRSSPSLRSDLGAAGDPARAAAARRREAATARHHRQRGDAADADPVPHPPTRRPARARRADRSRPAGRAPRRQRLWPHRDGARPRRICGARGPRRSLPVGRGAGAAARFLRRRDRERSPLRSRPRSAPSTGSRASPCSPPRRPCSTKAA